MTILFESVRQVNLKEKNLLFFINYVVLVYNLHRYQMKSLRDIAENFEYRILFFRYH